MTSLAQTLHEWMRIIMRHSMRNFILYAKEKNYSMAQLNALFRIHHKGACGVSDLGEEMGVTSAAASQLLEKLVQQGLVIRSEDPNDRRNKLITLTAEGQRIIQESMAARQGWLTRLAELLTSEEQEQVNAALQLLIEKTALLDAETAAWQGD
jgi:DNA-binding MarR family transcriptional regulator